MVLFYNPRAADAHRRLPLSLLALAAGVEGRVPWSLVDGNLEPDPLARLETAISAHPAPRLLAVTVMPGRQLEIATAHCRRIKARHPGLTIVWGGYFPSDHAEVCLRAPFVDYVVRGNGEATLPELLELLEGGRRREAIDGLSWRAEDGTFRHNQPRAIPDPNLLPRYPYERIETEAYVARTYLGNRTLSHHSSYGCPFACGFCSVVVTYQTRWLAEEAGRTIDVVRHLHRQWGIDALEFHDNNFFVSEARTRAIADGIAPLGISWWGEARSDTLLRFSDRTWSAMRDSGLRMVFTGAESGSDEMLARMNKGGTQTGATILEAARRFRAFDIVPEFSFVLGHPPDPEGDIRRNLEFIRRIKQINPRAEIILYLYTPVPLPGMFDEAVAAGFRYPETLEEWVDGGWTRFSRRRDPRTPWITDRHRRLLDDFETVLNARYPTATDIRLTPLARAACRMAGGLRWRFGLWGAPVELRLMLRALRYRRPEEEGFPQSVSGPSPGRGGEEGDGAPS
ncbi:MAG: B12-binding domain-containing radical SAM protein [Candidatus Eisenbacteria bacterium]|nr:B12-binding domain-containing radical SAM protein [Candidatus Eisenbacteria bacterium]MCC7144051.1 B12-binding domain-containing radical SAM protein [Candidatus Eisenbacteria bacterium]